MFTNGTAAANASAAGAPIALPLAPQIKAAAGEHTKNGDIALRRVAAAADADEEEEEILIVDETETVLDPVEGLDLSPVAAAGGAAADDIIALPITEARLLATMGLTVCPVPHFSTVIGEGHARTLTYTHRTA